MAKKKYAIKWHEGIRVPSDEFPSHKEGKWIEVPPRVKRKHTRKLVEAGQRTRLALKHKDYLSNEEAEKLITATMLEIGFRWNWEDGNGTALPQPTEDPDVLNEISDAEFEFIMEHLRDGTKIPPPKPIAS